MAEFHVPDAILFKFSLFLNNSRVTDGRMDTPTYRDSRTQKKAESGDLSSKNVDLLGFGLGVGIVELAQADVQSIQEANDRRSGSRIMTKLSRREFRHHMHSSDHVPKSFLIFKWLRFMPPFCSNSVQKFHFSYIHLVRDG